MKREQKIVAIGAASGVACMALAVWLLTQLLPSPGGIDTMSDRIVYALRVNLVALVPFFVMLIAIGNSRFLSDAIDPTRRAETAAQQRARHVGHCVSESRHDSLRAVLAGEWSMTTR